MYLARRPRTAPPATSGSVRPDGEALPRRWLAVGHNVVLLGLTSLVTDASSEMVGSPQTGRVHPSESPRLPVHRSSCRDS
jgi:hypothetical protein